MRGTGNVMTKELSEELMDAKPRGNSHDSGGVIEEDWYPLADGYLDISDSVGVWD